MLDNLVKFGIAIAVALLAYRLLPSREDDGGIAKKAIPSAYKDDSGIYESSRIINVTENVYVAIGYSLANMILLEGTDGIIIVDTTENAAVAVDVLNDFRKITDKPLKGIIVTHFHPDHLNGAAALVKEAKSDGDDVNIYMHSTSASEFRNYMKSSAAGFKRMSRQFGVFLDRETDNIYAGVGPTLHMRQDKGFDIASPTHTFDEEETFTLAGITFTLMHTPGETKDHSTVWIPDWKVVLPGDNIYEWFPNLYTIRGSPSRSCEVWYRSLDKVRRLGAHYMVPSHTRPVTGQHEVYDTITHYRDAIQFVNDQTIRYMNEGYDADRIVQLVKLPPSLESHRYLQQGYGTMDWSVRGVYTEELGWFDGDPVNLNPLPKEERAKKLNELLSTDYGNKMGTEIMLLKAKECLEKSANNFESTGYVLRDELQWALELSSNALKASASASEVFERAKQVHLELLRAMAISAPNSNSRNYYLTSAKELETGLVLAMPKERSKEMIKGVKIEDLMSVFPYRLKAEACDDNMILTVIFEFTDVMQSHSYTIRHCVMEYLTDPLLIPKKFDAKLKVSSTVWKEIMIKERSALTSYATGDVIIEGGVLSLKKFLDLIAQG